MSLRSTLVGGLFLLAIAGLLFHFLERQLSRASFAFQAHPDVLAQLESSLDDQKELARLDPAGRDRYRRRFGEVELLLQRMRILGHSREAVVRRYELILLVGFGFTIMLMVGAALIRQRRDLLRLGRLREALAGLAAGRTDLDLGERRRDTIGRIAAMIERTSNVMARDRRRLAALDSLSAWQEAARRHAHEIRTPLTGAKLELTKMGSLLDAGPEENRAEIVRAAESALGELDRLRRFTEEFTSFARLPRPERRTEDVTALVREFVATFDEAWPRLDLVLDGGGRHLAQVDRDMLRQVLVNLCDNSENALEGRNGSVTLRIRRHGSELHLDVVDDGPGVAESLRSRLFDPYTTTRSIGQGMGLGLAICRKVLLDHEGDLELVETSPSGTTFRLILPIETESDGRHDEGPGEDS